MTRQHDSQEAALPAGAQPWRMFRDRVRGDLAVNDGVESRLTLLIWRLGNLSYESQTPLRWLVRAPYVVLDLLWCRMVCAAELPASVVPGPGLRLPHAGRGVILSPTVLIGSGVTVYHQTTIGVRGPGGAAAIGDGVYIGAGAKIVGEIVVGRGSRVGANAVVLADVPENVTVVGIPAKTVRSRQ